MSDAPAAAAKAPTVFDDESSGLAKRYAEALLGAAGAGGQVEQVLDELEAVGTEVLGGSPQFAGLLASPTRTAADKDALLSRAFEGRATPTVINFLRVLNRHGRLGLLGSITRSARASSDRRRGRRPVTVRSARPLDDGQSAALLNKLAGLLGGEPVVHYEVDPALLGGLVVQAGDDVYDASVRNRLEQLRHRLIEGKTHAIQTRRDHFSSAE